MYHRPIAYNLVCGFLGAREVTPRGIERIDFGYASHLFDAWPAECVGVLPMPWGIRFYPRDRVLRARDQLARIWREVDDIADDRAFQRLRKRIAVKNARIEPGPIGSPRLAGYWRALRLLLSDGVDLGQPIDRLPRDALYLDIGHNGISHDFLLRWLSRRPDVTPVFMVHDVIPLEFPELVAQSNVDTHARILASSARYARAIVAPTEAAASAIRRHLALLGALDIAITPIGLPIDAVFNAETAADPILQRLPYFVVCGAIEARKNHALLITVWRDLVAMLGPTAPRLIIAGKLGYGAESLIDQIDRSRLLRDHVIIASGLSSKAIAVLIAGARALLMPSFAEGFGLPPVEALSVGTPAILSDIPAHREATGDFGLYLDPTDGPGWRKQILSFNTDTEDYHALKRRIATYKPRRWSDYMAEVKTMLCELD